MREYRIDVPRGRRERWRLDITLELPLKLLELHLVQRLILNLIAEAQRLLRAGVHVGGGGHRVGRRWVAATVSAWRAELGFAGEVNH